MKAPTYTKRHYIDTARIIREATFVNGGKREATRGAIRVALARGFADLFAADNPRFDRARFEAAVFQGEIVERPGCTPRPL